MVDIDLLRFIVVDLRFMLYEEDVIRRYPIE